MLAWTSARRRTFMRVGKIFVSLRNTFAGFGVPASFHSAALVFRQLHLWPGMVAVMPNKKNRSCVGKTSAARLVTLLKSRYPSHCKSSVQFCLLCCQPEPVSESLHCQAKFGAVCTAPSLQPASLAGTQLPTQYTTVRLRSLRSCNPSAKVCDRKIPHL